MAGKISISLHPRAPDAGEPDDPEMLEGMRLGLESYIANLEKTLLLPGEEMDALGMSAPAGSSSSSSAGPPPPPPPPPAIDLPPAIEPPPAPDIEMSASGPAPGGDDVSSDQAGTGNIAASAASSAPAEAAYTAPAQEASSSAPADAGIPLQPPTIPLQPPTIVEEEEEVREKSWEDVSAAAASVWDMIMADEEEEAEKLANPVDAMFPNGLPGVSEVEKQVEQFPPFQVPPMMFRQGFPPMKQAAAEAVDPVDLMFPNGLPKASEVDDEPDPVDLMFPNGLPKASDVEEDPVDVMFPNGLPSASQVADASAGTQPGSQVLPIPEASLPVPFTGKQNETGTSMALTLPGVPPSLPPKAADVNLAPAFTAPALGSHEALPVTAPGLAPVTAMPSMPLPAMPSMPLPALPAALPPLAAAGSSTALGNLGLNPGVPLPPAAGLAPPDALEKLAPALGTAEAAADQEAQMALYSAAMEAQQAQYMQQMQFFQQMRNQPSNAPMKRRGGRFTEDFQPFRLCKRFMNGDCWQGQACTYAHDFEELHPASPDLPQQEEACTSALAEQTPSKPEEDTTPDMRLRKKLDLCMKFKNNGSCERGKRCPYAHGEEELGTVAFVVCEKVKLRICKHWSQGACMYGKTCIYAHGAEEIGTKQPPFMGPPIKKRKEGESLDDWRKSVLREDKKD
mmetsp:Transcript_131229/g.245568  ORF Transcript_131229/g.245568 Transcript_131229/m.245568 type:complete len:680 (+) Transcript_131229:156-2195(+)